jgi:hypothetical protein
MILTYLPIYVFLLCNSEFDAQTWRSDRQPTQKQLDNMHQSGIQIERSEKAIRGGEWEPIKIPRENLAYILKWI